VVEVSQARAAPVGLVAGTEDSTPLLFSVALAPEAYLQLDDVVVTVRAVPGVGPVLTSGIVTQVRARHEGASFGSDVFLIRDGVLPAQVQEIAEITTTRVDPECYVPPRPGEPVHRATGDERAQALYFDRMDRKVPVGLGRDGEPIYLNLEFLDGTRGGHVSISGISGVATKTSFALFLLYSIFRSGVLGNRSVNAKALIFSVKGEDLLFLDHSNKRLVDSASGPELVEGYARLGLPAEPFASAGFYAPPTPDDPSGRPYVTGRTSGISPFWWTLREFCAEELLRFAFADAEDERNQYTSVIYQVSTRLRYDAMAAGIDGAVSIEGRLLRTYADLVGFISDKLTDEDSSVRAPWAGPVTGTGTINAFLRRLRSSLAPLRSVVRGDLADTPGRRISTEGQQVTVVDLHNLPERAQRFVVGVVLAAETARKEAAGPGGLLFTMIDELNKYAPREGSSPIKEVLLDIAERGRSLGIILIGAQQTASEVERRIVANSSIKVVGRLDSAEAGRPEYGFLPPSQRGRATLARPGTMFVSQPEIPVPLAVEFPFPAWATRLSESAGEPVRAPATGTLASSNGSAGNGSARSPLSRLPVVDDEPPF
jgi:DNA helicase HerA-like ATPase